MYGAFDDCGFQVDFSERHAGSKTALKRLVQVNHHDHARFDGDAEQGDVSHPDCDAEVVAKVSLKDKPSSKGVKGWKDQDGGLGDGMEHHIEQDKNHEKHDGYDQLQALLRAQLEFVFAGPFICVTGRKRELLPEHAVRLGDESAVVGRVEIDVDVASQRRVLIADHGGAARKRNLGDFANGDLRAVRRSNQEAAQRLDVVAKIPAVSDVDGITLAALDVFGDGLAADARRDHLLDISDGQTVPRSFGSVDLDVYVKALADPFGEDRPHARKRRQDALHLRASLLNAVEARPLNFHAERCLDARQLHIEPVFDGHGPGIGQPRKLEFGVHFLNELFVGHACSPLLAGLQHHGRVVHIERCVVGCALGAPDSAENALHFWKRTDDAVLLLHKL